MMNKEMLAELATMVEEAEILGCTLLLEQRINLVEYTAKGKIKAFFLYDYNDPNCITQIRAQLDQICNNLRQEWELEFQRMAPALQALNWTMEFGYAVSITDEDGDTALYPYSGDGIQMLSEDISDCLLAQHAEDFESDEQDERHPIHQSNRDNAKKPDPAFEAGADEPKQEEAAPIPEAHYCLAIGMHIIDLDQLMQNCKQTGCGGHQCQGCDNQHCQQDPQLIETLWYNITEESQQKLMQSLSPEKQAELKRCLGKS